MVTGILTARLAAAGLQDQVTVQSVGLRAAVGQPAMEDATRLMSGQGIDISDHRASQLQEADIVNADLVIVMEERHRRQLFYIAPESLHKVILFSELIGEHTDLADPFGKNGDIYAETFRRIEYVLDRGWTKLLNFLQLDQPTPSIMGRTLAPDWIREREQVSNLDDIQGRPVDRARRRPIRPPSASKRGAASRSWWLVAVLLLALGVSAWTARGPIRQAWFAQTEGRIVTPAPTSRSAQVPSATATLTVTADGRALQQEEGNRLTVTVMPAPGGDSTPTPFTTANAAENLARALSTEAMEPQTALEAAQTPVSLSQTPAAPSADMATPTRTATTTPAPTDTLVAIATANRTVEAIRAQLLQRVTAIALVLSATPTLSSVETPNFISTPSATTMPRATATARLLIGSQPPVLTETLPGGLVDYTFVLSESSPAVLGEAWQVAWQTSFVLSENEAFEVVFWNEGQDPIRDGIALAAPTTDDRLVVDLTALDSRQARLLEPGDYRYGVLLVRLSPYERVRYFGMSLAFRMVEPGDDE
jgi:protein-tyrosine-phosphatase